MGAHFIKTVDPKEGRKTLFAHLQKELTAGKKVLWLLSGGSNITSEAWILGSLIQDNQTKSLTVMLMDERFGQVGHPDSNWLQLQQSGCDFTKVHALPVMTIPEKSLHETVEEYATNVATAMNAADVIIGQFGLGEDGHTAGILPGSPFDESTPELVMGYEAPPFTRITLTQQALLQVDVAYIFAFGVSKRSVLFQLQDGHTTIPAAFLTGLPEVYVYNDQVDEERA